MTPRAMLLLALAGCTAQPTFAPVVAFESPGVEAQTDRVEVYLTSSPCAEGVSAASPPVASPGGYALGPRVLRRGGAAEPFGDVARETPAWLWARALGAGCQVLAAGCVRVDLSRGSGDVRVVLRALPAPQSLCGLDERCEAERCVTALDATTRGDADDADDATDATDAADAMDVTDVTDVTDASAYDVPDVAVTDAPLDRPADVAVVRPDVVVTDAPPRCVAPQVLCGGVCVSLGTDLNCRACGDNCGGNDVLCCDGMCVNTRTNNNHCGRCNNPCGGRDDRCCRSTCMQTCP